MRRGLATVTWLVLAGVGAYAVAVLAVLRG